MRAFGIIFLIVIIALLGWLFVKSTKSGKRIVKTLIYLYGAVLLSAAIVYEFLPDKKGEAIEKVQISGNIDQETSNFEQAIFDGRLDMIPESMILKEWEQPFEGTELKIQSEGELNVLVVIEQKDVNDGLIEGKYLANVIFHSLDFSEKIPPVEHRFDGQTLFLKNDPETFHYRGVSYKKEFVIAQFIEERQSINERVFGRDIRYIYLRVPKDIKLDIDEDVMYNFTGEVSIEWHNEGEETETEE